MTYYSLLSNQNRDSFLLTTTNYPIYKRTNSQPKLTKKTRSKTILGTSDYQRSLRRSFSRAKMLAFFNPDMDSFVTFTYAKNNNTPEEVQRHIKQYMWKLKRNQIKEGKKIQIKYIYVMEYQKRGSIHVHMVCNDTLPKEKNIYGHWQLKGWSHGFTNVQSVKNFDDNFKPYLYLFKYMHKAQRIGDSFIHTSRNIDKTQVLDYRDYIDTLKRGNAYYTEDHQFEINDRPHRIIKEYYRPSLSKDNEEKE